MLNYNLQRLFQLKGITEPLLFLIKAGIPRGAASRLVNKKISSLSTNHVEKLCLIFKCTPNDLLEWTPAKSGEIDTTQPLTKLMATSVIAFDMRSVQNEIPLDKLPAFYEKINEMKKEFVSGK